MTPGEIIRASRERAGLSQRQLAERAGTSAPAISFYETGERMPRVDTLQRIVDATGAELKIAVEFDGDLSSRAIDLEDNARSLQLVLGLADHLPRESSEDLEYPVLRDEVL
ncbi:MAG: helix-turn-helix transcriptional regulator [Acidimicrobiales bacterium]|nr:helix-turn-helix transcriptional regulator [Acidimicrobiales bacterium]